MPAFFTDYYELKKQQKAGDGSFEFGHFYPCLNDKSAASGRGTGHYFHQDLLVASRVFANRPERHVDVGSRVDGFVAHVASFRRILVVDIRPLTSPIRNVEYRAVDIMKTLPVDLVGSCDSLSCLHVLEHLGLGRYGDSVRWDGYRVGFENLVSMLNPGGTLYLSVPISSEQRIEFNAHRVFSIAHLLEMFLGRFHIDDFSYVDDRGNLNESIRLDPGRVKTGCGCRYGCGIFELTKLNDEELCRVNE